MQLKVMVSENDIKNFQKFTLKGLNQKKAKTKHKFLKEISIWITLVIIFIFIFRVTSFSLKELHIPTLIVTACPFILFICLFGYFFIKLQQNTMPKKNGIVLGDKLFKLDEEGISEITPLMKSFYKWGAVDSVCENKDDIYIYFDNSIAQVIPGSAFSSLDEKLTFMQFIRQQTNKTE